MLAKTIENIGCFADELRCLGQFLGELGLLSPAHVLFEFESCRHIDQVAIKRLLV